MAAPHLRNTEELLARDVFAHVLDATSPVPALVEALLELLDIGEAGHTPASR